MTKRFALNLPLLLALAALLVWGGREVEFGKADVQVDKQAQLAGWVQESIDAQMATLGCDTHKRLSPKVAVRNAARDGRGRIQFDTTVVRVVTFDEGLRLAQAGSVWVVGWCG